jgi:hypothetical protein
MPSVATPHGVDLHYTLTASNPSHNEEKTPDSVPLDDRFIVKWEGEYDTQNPKNFPALRKWMCVLVVSTGSLLV